MSGLREALDAARQPGDLHEALDAVTGRGQVQVSVSELIPAFELAAEREPDTERKAKLKAAADSLRTLGRDFVLHVAADVLVRSIGL